MSRYIDADALTKEIKQDIADNGLTERYVFYRINEAPSIDIEPKRGEWIYQFRDSENEEYKCSECDYPTAVKHYFCPNCGADMRPKGRAIDGKERVDE